MNSLRKKRKAPPPPNPFTGEVDAFSNPLRQDSVEYYEKVSYIPLFFLLICRGYHTKV